MARLIEILLEEHRNIEKLLLVLEQELNVFDHTESPDYEILQTVVEYFLEYPEKYHHPKEDIIFEKLKLRDPTAAASIGDAEAEHQLETTRLHRFAQAIEDILAGREYPRQSFHNIVSDFIDYQRQHMQKEEKFLYPAAIKGLRNEDWVEIDTRLNSKNDPLFDELREKRFDALRQTVLRWEKETQANRGNADRLQN
jgi:hemerythrin-like domain-containing protein